MTFLNSEALLDLLVKQRLLTDEQRQFIILHKGKQRQKLLKQYGGRRQEDENKQAEGLSRPGGYHRLDGAGRARPEKEPLGEEIIMRAVSHGLKIPFKKLDPLELDMDTVTKTIPDRLRSII
jgi:general secretion pathway protein E